MLVDLASSQEAYLLALQRGDESAAQAVVAAVRADGVDPATIYLRIFAPSMIAIGTLWEHNRINVAEEHLATAITERLIGQLSIFFDRTAPGAAVSMAGLAILGCVAGERHALGVRMLVDLFREQGWQVVYLGSDVPTDDWVVLIERCRPDLVAIAATANRHTPEVQQLIGRIRLMRPEILILVGGALFDDHPDLWQSVGADLYSRDPLAAIGEATRRVGRQPHRDE